MSDTDHLYISRHDLTALSDLLRGIPTLALELAISTTKQARISNGDRGKKSKKPGEQPLPYNVDAAEKADALHNELVGWVRLVCEQRALDPPVMHATGTVAKWLRTNIIALAMTEGSETALAAIRDVVQAAEWVVCPPIRPITVDAKRVELARAQRLNATGIAVLAQEMGEEYRNLTRRRVQVLRDAGVIKPVPGPWSPDWPTLYVVGDVLEAHLLVPIRRRHSKSACEA